MEKPWGLVPTIAKQATNQAVRFPVQFYAKQFLTGGDKSLDANPIYNGIFAEVWSLGIWRKGSEWEVCWTFFGIWSQESIKNV